MNIAFSKSPPSTSSRFRNRSMQSGATLVEALIASVIVVLFLAEMYYANSRGLAMLKFSRENTVVSNTIQTRVEQIRNSTYTQITDPAYISGTNSLGAAIPSQIPLRQFTETIDVNSYPLPSGYPGALDASTIEVKRNSDGTVTVTGSGNGTLSSQTALQIDFKSTWTADSNGVPRQRQCSIIVSSQGIAGQNQ